MTGKSKNGANGASKKKDQTAERIIKAAAESNGLIKNIAARAKLGRNTITRYVKEYPSVSQAVDDAKEELYDLTESELIKKIKDGDLTAIIFFLKTRCKHRGYIERQEIDIPRDVTIRVKYEE